MCTAIFDRSHGAFFGRTLDLECSFGEEIKRLSRGEAYPFIHEGDMSCKYSIIGMAISILSQPLFYDAVNEKGLSVAALNFPDNASYNVGKIGKLNIAVFELIPFILGQCSSVEQALPLLKKINITCESFDSQLGTSPLHWMICDSEKCIVAEPMQEGMKIHDDPIGVLTNNPPFEYHMLNLVNYMNLTPGMPHNSFCDELKLTPFSNGMGAVGLPGDMSSASRFVRAAFTKLNAAAGKDETESVSQFFHIMQTVSQISGCVRLPNGKYERTVYTCCCNTDKGIYYYNTYENSQIFAVDMNKEHLDRDSVISYPLMTEARFNYQN